MKNKRIDPKVLKRNSFNNEVQLSCFLIGDVQNDI